MALLKLTNGDEYDIKGISKEFSIDGLITFDLGDGRILVIRKEAMISVLFDTKESTNETAEKTNI